MKYCFPPLSAHQYDRPVLWVTSFCGSVGFWQRPVPAAPGAAQAWDRVPAVRATTADATKVEPGFFCADKPASAQDAGKGFFRSGFIISSSA